MSELGKCAICGAPLRPTASGNRCLRCLLAIGLEGENNREEGPPAEASSSRRRLGDYELLEEIARGGMGIVYKARQISLNRTVAVKMLLASSFGVPEVVERFRTEAEAAASLHHPNIVPIHEFGQVDGQYYIVMEYVEGQDLGQLVRKQTLSPRQAAEYLKTVTEAIRFAHDQGILHRDVKPSNILVDTHNQVHITDFGVAKRLRSDSDLTLTGQSIGTPTYSAPEQMSGRHKEVGPHSDVYSLGAVLYWMLTGRPPFIAESTAALLQQAQEREVVSPRLLNPAVPRDLESICLRCLEKEGRRRYASAAALGFDLGRYLEGRPVEARPITRLGKLQRWCGRKPVVAGLTATSIVILVLGIAGVVWQWRRAEEQGRLYRLRAYASDVRAADFALREERVTQARELLERNIPKPGEEDLRGIPWRYLWHRARSEAIAVMNHEGAAFGAISRDGKWLTTFHLGKGCVWSVPEQEVLFDAPADHPGNFQMSEDGEWLAACSDQRLRMWSIPKRQSVFEAKVEGQPDLSCLTWNFNAATRQLLYADKDGVLHAWDPISRRERELPMRIQGLRSLRYSEDATRLAIWSEEGLDVWDTQSWVKVAKDATFASPQSQAWIIWSPEGSNLLLNERGRWPTIWSTDTMSAVHTFERADSVAQVSFSDDGRRLAFGTTSGKALIWDLKLNQSIIEFEVDSGSVMCLALSADGQLLATTGEGDSAVRLWEANTGTPLRSFRGHNAVVLSLSFADSGVLCSVGLDGAIRLWSTDAATTGTPLFSLPLEELPVGWSADLTRLMTLDRDLSIHEWTLPVLELAGTTQLEWTNNCEALQGLSLMNRLLIGQDVAGWIHIWERSTGKRIAALESKRTRKVAMHPSPDGRHLLLATPVYETLFNPAPAATMPPELWNVSTHQLEVTFEDPQEALPFGVFSPDGRYCAYTASAFRVGLWDTTARRHLGYLEGHEGLITCLEFSDDSRWVVTVSADKSVCIWNVKERQLVGPPLTRGGIDPWSAGFCPDQRSLVVISRDFTASFWNLATRREMVSDLTFSMLNLAGERLSFGPLKEGDILWCEDTLLAPISRDGNAVLEHITGQGFRLTRLPALEEIDAEIRSRDSHSKSITP